MQEIPLTRQGTPDRRYSKGRATCKYCGRHDLIWERTDEYGREHWRICELSGSRHECSRASPTISYAEVTDEVLTQKVRTIIEPQLNQYTNSLTVAVAGKAKQEVVSAIEAAKSLLFAQVAEVAVQAAKNVIPQEHILTINVGDCTAKIEGRPHKHLPILIQVCAQRLYVFMVGPAGSGKTTAASQVAIALNLPYYEGSMGPATSQWDLFGFRNANGDYVPGLMREPYEKGGVLMLDEMDNSNPSVLTALNSALGNGHATFPDGRVAKHPDFICIAAGNTYGRGADRLYVGRNQLDAATLDRFVVIEWDYDEEAELDWTGRDQIDWTLFIQKVRVIVFKHAMRVVVSPRASIFGARLLRSGMAKDRVAELVLWKGMAKDDKSRIMYEAGVTNNA